MKEFINLSLANKYYTRKVHGKHVHRFIVTNHYAQRIPNIQFAFGLFSKSDKKMIGVMSFGSCPNPKLQMKCPWTIIELNRIVLINNQKNIVTWWMSKCIHQLPQPILLVSWADQNQGHIGYVYQAANWIYSGKSSLNPELLVNGRIKHHRNLTKNNIQKWEREGKTIKEIQTLAKYRYFFPLGTKSERRKMKEYIVERFGEHPYPKGVSKRYDMTDERVKKESIETIKNRLF